MDYNLLKYFNTVCEEGSIAAASKKLYISTSALSQAIKQLEGEVGYPLFDRVNNRLRLNDRGREIKKHAEVIIEDFDDLQNTIDSFGPDRTYIRLCSEDPSCLRYYLPIAIENFPSIVFSGTLLPQKVLKQKMIEQEYDIGFSFTDYHNDPRFYSIPFGDDRLFAYIPVDLPISEKSSLKIEDLDGQSVIVTNTETTYTQIILRLLKEKCSPKTKVRAISDYGVYKQLIATSKQYISFVSWRGTHFYNELPSRRYVPLTDPEFRQEVYLVYLRENENKLNTFLEWIRKTYSDMLI